MMFKKADDKKIGIYLSKKIKDCKYKSARQFCRDWLIEENIEPDNVELQRRSNKLSQIKKGTKSIQIDDLPIFTKLLGITCEEILSAGKSFVPDDNRMTNYKFAFSTDESLWEAYIKRNDNLILNTDEYEKTVIEYALEFKNYKLLKYLTDNGYIWFVGDDEKRYFRTFSAGTSIERKPYIEYGLEYILHERDELRRKMITLAIENQDFEMLDEMKAREIPTLYQARYNGQIDCRSYYDEEMIEAIAKADERTLDYFTEEFELTLMLEKKNKFIFPFVSELIDALVKNKSKYVSKIIDRCIEHNKNTLEKFEQLVLSEEQDIYAATYTQSNMDFFSEKELEKRRANSIRYAVQFMEFYDVDGMLHFAKSNYKDGITTNVIRVSAESSDEKISEKITQLNKLYDQIKKFKENVENGK